MPPATTLHYFPKTTLNEAHQRQQFQMRNIPLSYLFNASLTTQCHITRKRHFYRLSGRDAAYRLIKTDRYAV